MSAVTIVSILQTKTDTALFFDGVGSERVAMTTFASTLFRSFAGRPLDRCSLTRHAVLLMHSDMHSRMLQPA